MRTIVAVAALCATLSPAASGQPITNLSRMSDLFVIVETLMPTTQQCGITPDLLTSAVSIRMSGSPLRLKTYNSASLEAGPSLKLSIKTILLPLGLCLSSLTLTVDENGPYFDLSDGKTIILINDLMFQDDSLVSSTVKDHPEQIRIAVDRLASDFRAAWEQEQKSVTKP